MEEPDSRDGPQWAFQRGIWYTSPTGKNILQPILGTTMQKTSYFCKQRTNHQNNEVSIVGEGGFNGTLGFKEQLQGARPISEALRIQGCRISKMTSGWQD